MSNELLAQKTENFKKATNRQHPEYIPTMIGASCATVAWTGQKVTDIIYDADKYAKAMTDVFADMWADANICMGTRFTPKRSEAFTYVQNQFGPDGITPEHIQKSPMLEDEYDLLIADPEHYVRNVMLPRMEPRLYTDEAYAANALKVYAEDAYYCNFITMKTTEYLQKYGIPDVVDFRLHLRNPVDTLFDKYRGFKGTVLDMRRQPEKVKAAVQRIWETRDISATKTKPTDYPYACQMPHMPAYLSVKQYDEYYWPYEEQLIEHIGKNGCKSYFLMEGRFARIWDHFNDVTKDCLILHVDDDDFFEAQKALQDHQIIMGGLRMADVRNGSFEDIKDKVKKVVDSANPQGGFVFCTDKAWIAPGDVNQVLVDAYNFVHEYSKQ